MSNIIKNDNLDVSISFYDDIKSIIIDSRNAAIRSVDFYRVLMGALENAYLLKNSTEKTVQNMASSLSAIFQNVLKVSLEAVFHIGS
ncbi:MAG: hypothetical protein FWH46_00665 [Methanimicrococcus sp.]|nr:hypothetical protein [Methanimicrococcus sp.]